MFDYIWKIMPSRNSHLEMFDADTGTINHNEVTLRTGEALKAFLASDAE